MIQRGDEGIPSMGRNVKRRWRSGGRGERRRGGEEERRRGRVGEKD
jgi:hypothetical protein